MSNTFPVPENEDERLKKLAEYNIMDTAPELVFDEITELAAEILNCPASFIKSLPDASKNFANVLILITFAPIILFSSSRALLREAN